MDTISRRFFSAAAHDKTAIVCGDEYRSYAALAEDVAKLSQGLAMAGVQPGDAIAAIGPNSIRFVTLMLAAADLGAMLVPLSTSLPNSAVGKALRACDARHLIAPIDQLQSLAAADVSVTGVTAALDGPDGLDALTAIIPDGVGPLDWGRIDDAFILTLTSGSTGDPKPIVLTQRSKLERAGAAVRLYDITPEDKILAATPLYHSLAERLVLIPLLIGAQSVLLPRYSPELWINAVETRDVSFTIAVSSQLSAIAKRLEAAGEIGLRCKSLRCVVSSSAALSVDDKSRVRAALPGELHECYGASEIAIATSLNVSDPAAPTASVGRPAHGVDVKILDAAGEDAAPGEIGEIACRTPMLFGGYFGRPQDTQDAICGEYFKTGDLGRIDPEGWLFFHGRKKELIITGGVNVYPADVEDAVASCPGVAQAAAFAWPDERLGEIVAVALVAEDGADLSAVRCGAGAPIGLPTFSNHSGFAYSTRFRPTPWAR